MSDREEWGPWIEHDHSGCPVVGMWIRAVTLGPDGELVEGEGIPRLEDPRDWKCWTGGGRYKGTYCHPVIRYQVRKPRALQQLREMIETLPAPSRQKEDAHV